MIVSAIRPGLPCGATTRGPADSDLDQALGRLVGHADEGQGHVARIQVRSQLPRALALLHQRGDEADELVPLLHQG